MCGLKATAPAEGSVAECLIAVKRFRVTSCDSQTTPARVAGACRNSCSPRSEGPSLRSRTAFCPSRKWCRRFPAHWAAWSGSHCGPGRRAWERLRPCLRNLGSALFIGAERDVAKAAVGQNPFGRDPVRRLRFRIQQRSGQLLWRIGIDDLLLSGGIVADVEQGIDRQANTFLQRTGYRVRVVRVNRYRTLLLSNARKLRGDPLPPCDEFSTSFPYASRC